MKKMLFGIVIAVCFIFLFLIEPVSAGDNKVKDWVENTKEKKEERQENVKKNVQQAQENIRENQESRQNNRQNWAENNRNNVQKQLDRIGDSQNSHDGHNENYSTSDYCHGDCPHHDENYRGHYYYEGNHYYGYYDPAYCVQEGPGYIVCY